MFVFACVVPSVNDEHDHLSLSMLLDCLSNRAFPRTFQVTLLYSLIGIYDKFSS